MDDKKQQLGKTGSRKRTLARLDVMPVARCAINQASVPQKRHMRNNKPEKQCDLGCRHICYLPLELIVKARDSTRQKY